MSKYLIKGASLYGEKVADILIEDGVISRIAENIDAADAQVVEAAGQVALPGLVDIHTHLRHPRCGPGWLHRSVRHGELPACGRHRRRG